MKKISAQTKLGTVLVGIVIALALLSRSEAQYTLGEGLRTTLGGVAVECPMGPGMEEYFHECFHVKGNREEVQHRVTEAIIRQTHVQYTAPWIEIEWETYATGYAIQDMYYGLFATYASKERDVVLVVVGYLGEGASIRE